MKKIMYTIFIFNFLFSLLTAILPLLVYDLTKTPSTSGYVLTTFMLALIASRLLLFKFYIKELILLKFGLFFYCLGFVVLTIFSNYLLPFYVGAVFFGIGVGTVAPALLTMITNIDGNKKLMIGLHNSFMGVASAIAPLVGVFLFYNIEQKLYLYFSLFFLALTILIPSFFVKAGISDNDDSKNSTSKFNKRIFKLDYLSNYFTFLLTSISYGSIIAYLPILLEQINLRIDMFYFFFWSFFVLAQLYMPAICSYLSEKLLMTLSILIIALSTVLLGFSSNDVLLIFNAVMFGFSYGGLMNIFYNRIAMVKDNKSKTNAFSIFGLMSYLGVGLGAMLLSPIANNSLTKVFIISAIFPVGALIINLLFASISNKRAEWKTRLRA
ncbi:Cyanate permease [Evansella caseinilytica]|uniref:Cyanate permease n=1 Tax=Evansella caseinilytica TaxID=1503961 RepID=A0A1H3RNG9_9BACI|nr:MFS transporter [Evansella caseinilytica]SDZ26449.1 Cyanate permease [Evansella caseinilytica]